MDPCLIRVLAFSDEEAGSRVGSKPADVGRSFLGSAASKTRVSNNTQHQLTTHATTTIAAIEHSTEGVGLGAPGKLLAALRTPLWNRDDIRQASELA